MGRSVGIFARDDGRGAFDATLSEDGECYLMAWDSGDGRVWCARASGGTLTDTPGIGAPARSMMGVTVVPLEKAEEIVQLAQEQADREEETRKWVAQGKTVEDLLNEFGRI